MNRSQASLSNLTLINNPSVDSSNRIRTFVNDPDADHDVNSSPINQEADAIDKETENGNSLRSSVWKHATKIAPDTARCNACGKTMKTINGGTSSLRKHLLHQHHVVPTPSRKSCTRPKRSSISKEKKTRLDHLLKLATFEDGRSFGDFRKSGMMKFLAEAVPGENIAPEKTSNWMFNESGRFSR